MLILLVMELKQNTISFRGFLRSLKVDNVLEKCMPPYLNLHIEIQFY